MFRYLVWSLQTSFPAVCFAAPEEIYTRNDSAGGIRFSDPWPRNWNVEWDKRRDCAGVQEGERNYLGNLPAKPEDYTDAERLALLTKAGALIAAEIDRLLRKGESK